MAKLPLDKFSISVSESVEDPMWDHFLEGTHLGQYQQSSRWARYKVSEGWNPLRYIYSAQEEVIGGLQILCKGTRFGRVGYIPKGPVFPDSGMKTIEHVVGRLVHLVRENNFSALIVQPPDECIQFPDILKKNGFLNGKSLGVIDSTLLIPTSRDFTEIEEGMTRYTRKAIRQSRKRGVSIREGNEQDLVTFFDLMANSSMRQGARAPNPSNVILFGKLWESFHQDGHCRLTIAEHEGTVLAGLFCLIYGDRLTLWKKGWSGRDPGLKPNAILYAEAISWAHRNGFAWCDFAGLSRDIAEHLTAGKPLTKAQTQSRDMFNIRFGGIPKLLPEAAIYIKSKVMRHAYSFLNHLNILNPIIKTKPF